MKRKLQHSAEQQSKHRSSSTDKSGIQLQLHQFLVPAHKIHDGGDTTQQSTRRTSPHAKQNNSRVLNSSFPINAAALLRTGDVDSFHRDALEGNDHAACASTNPQPMGIDGVPVDFTSHTGLPHITSHQDPPSRALHLPVSTCQPGRDFVGAPSSAHMPCHSGSQSQPVSALRSLNSRSTKIAHAHNANHTDGATLPTDMFHGRQAQMEAERTALGSVHNHLSKTPDALHHIFHQIAEEDSDCEHEEDISYHEDGTFLNEVAPNSRSMSLPLAGQKQLYDWLLVLDLESTCCETKDLAPVEIIEFGVVLVNARTVEQVAEFQSFVRPTEHSILTDFCTDLTGISQHDVDAAETLTQVLPRLHGWLQNTGALTNGPASVLPVTWGDWDLKTCLEMECRWRKVTIPPYLRHWHNLRQSFTSKYGPAPRLKGSVEAAGLTWQGRAHSGIDDARNTAALMIHMMCTKDLVVKVHGGFHDAPPPPGQAKAVQTTLTAFVRKQPPGDTRAGAVHPSSHTSDAFTIQSGIPPHHQQQQHARGKGSSTARAAWQGRCQCGVPAVLRTVKKPGPSHGRQFWSCGRFRLVNQGKGMNCEFFLWADDPAALEYSARNSKGDAAGGGKAAG